MAWIAPTTRTTGELITAAIWNTDVVDNLDALKDPPSQNYEGNESSDYTTSSTSFVDIDAGSGANDKFRRDIVTTGGDVLITFCGAIKCNSTYRVYLDVDYDGAQVAGNDGIANEENFGTNTRTVSFSWLLTGVAAGTHTFKIQWKVSNVSATATLYAGAGTAGFDTHPQFMVREVS